MKILLGGIPLGCDNIGDEAIIACVIGIVKRLAPGAELTVATRDMAGIRKKFGVEAAPLFGFDRENTLAMFAEEVKKHDWYIWAGATGLSDYPEMSCDLLETAQAAGVRTLIWNVGMNDSLNPAYFKLSGKKLLLASCLKKFFFYDIRPAWERRLTSRTRRRLARVVGRCELIVLRDPDSLAELRKCGNFPQACVGADSAILQQSTPEDALPWQSPEERETFMNGRQRVALCLSAQSPVGEIDKFAAWIDRAIAAAPDILFVMIPMNPLTDHAVMAGLQAKLKRPEATLLLRFIEPEDVQTVVGCCHLVISSRLHLMILGLNKLVPAVGIERGSKIRSFLTPFGLDCCGTTDKIDFEYLTQRMQQLLAEPDFAAKAGGVRERLMQSLAAAEHKLSVLLQR